MCDRNYLALSILLIRGSLVIVKVRDEQLKVTFLKDNICNQRKLHNNAKDDNKAHSRYEY